MRKARSTITTGLLRLTAARKKEGMMKFLLIVLLILFLGEVITIKMKNKTAKGDNNALMNQKHPAEFDLR